MLKKLVLGMGVVALLVLVIAITVSFQRARARLRQLATPAGQAAAAQAEASEMVQRLSKLAVIPTETPVVVTVADAAKLAAQSDFYKDAQTGDKLVLFTQAQKAYIYSPSRNVIVNVGSVTVQQAPPTPGTSTSEPVVSPQTATPSPTTQPL